MRLVFACALLHALLCIPAASLAESADTASLTLKAYLVYDVTTERVVAELNREHEQPVASLTKLMTAVLTCERLRFDGRYVLTEAEQKTFGVTTMRADKMLELMLVPSNNSICRVVARIAGPTLRKLGYTDSGDMPERAPASFAVPSPTPMMRG